MAAGISNALDDGREQVGSSPEVPSPSILATIRSSSEELGEKVPVCRMEFHTGESSVRTAHGGGDECIAKRLDLLCGQTLSHHSIIIHPIGSTDRWLTGETLRCPDAAVEQLHHRARHPTIDRRRHRSQAPNHRIGMDAEGTTPAPTVRCDMAGGRRDEPESSLSTTLEPFDHLGVEPSSFDCLLVIAARTIRLGRVTPPLENLNGSQGRFMELRYRVRC